MFDNRTSIAASKHQRGPAKTIRMALLAATALTVGTLGFLAHNHTGAVRAETSGEVVTPFGRAPLSFADVIEKVRTSVVSIHVTNGGGAQSFGSGGPELFPDLPDDHPLKDFFKKFGINQKVSLQDYYGGKKVKEEELVFPIFTSYKAVSLD